MTVTYPIMHDGRAFTPDGEIPALETSQLNCGHKSQPAGIIAAGYVTWLGYTMCYDCAAEMELHDFSRASVYVGYLHNPRVAGTREITTWTGARLARVTSYSVSRALYTPTGGYYRRVSVRAKSPDGSYWHGRTSGDAMAITLRRCK